MITNYSKKTMSYLKVSVLALLALVSTGNLLAMEQERKPSKADSSLEVTRKYLETVRNSCDDIEQIFKKYDGPFREIHDIIKRLENLGNIIVTYEYIKKNIKNYNGVFSLEGTEYNCQNPTCKSIIDIINSIYTYIKDQKYLNQDISVNISSLDNVKDNNFKPLVSFAQKTYKTAQDVRLLKTYRDQLANDNQVKSLTKKLEIELIAKEKSLLLFNAIKNNIINFFGHINNVCSGSASFSPIFFNSLNAPLSEWIKTFNNQNNEKDFKERAQKICGDNWLIDRTYNDRINIKEKQENQRYNPLLSLNTNNYNDFKNALYINSPLMIDSLILLYGPKTFKENIKQGGTHVSYALKGTVYKLTWANEQDMRNIRNKSLNYTQDKNGNYWVRICDSNIFYNRNEGNYCDQVYFECAIHDETSKGLFIYHRGHSKPEQKREITQDNKSWFLSNNRNHLTQSLPLINAKKIGGNDQPNTYSTYIDNNGYYTDTYGNYINYVDDRYIIIFMPPSGNRTFAAEIVLERSGT